MLQLRNKIIKHRILYETFVYYQVGKGNQGKCGMHIAVRMLELYIEYLNVPYLLHNLDTVAIHDVAASSMYNYGSITYLEPAFVIS